MTTEPSRQRSTKPRTVAPTPRNDVRTFSGWVTFAAVMLLIAAAANIIWGIAALDTRTYLNQDGLFFSTLENWGWASIIWGALLLLVSLGLFSQSAVAAIVAVAFATISAVFWLFALPVLPIWALVMIAIDVSIIYGLVNSGLTLLDERNDRIDVADRNQAQI